MVTLRELKQQASAAGNSFRFHAQLEKCLQKTTKTGNPFYEVTFADAEETLVLRVWNNTWVAPATAPPPFPPTGVPPPV